MSARAVAIKDVPDGETLSGYPARPHREWLKTQANLQRIDSLRDRVKELERRLSKVEGPGDE